MQPQFLLNRLTGRPKATSGPLVNRKNPCGICQREQGQLVGQAHFWDLANINYVRCEQCHLVQVDPMLDPQTTATGCEAYYYMETLREGPRNLRKKKIRSFRRGVHFAYKIQKLGLTPQRVLEVGAGDGYFSRGVQFVFPRANIICLDIVPGVLRQIEATHGFGTVLGRPEQVATLMPNGNFDLIIARDIIEHTEEPIRVLESFASVLVPGGMVHIITPNGYEDIWQAYCRWKLKNEAAEMLINHVNFFAPQSLKQEFIRLGFKTCVWFIYDFNGTRWGRAGRLSESQMARPPGEAKALLTIAAAKPAVLQMPETHVDPLDYWWVQPRWPWLTRLYCFFKEARRFTLPADLGIGHEIYGILQKDQ